LWGLLWGIFVFGELHGKSGTTYFEVIGGSLLMIAGVGAIAFSSATGDEQKRWREAAQRESQRYGVSSDWGSARFDGCQAESEAPLKRGALDWFLVAMATAILLAFAAIAQVPELSFDWGPALLLTIALLALLVISGASLWRTTRFH